MHPDLTALFINSGIQRSFDFSKPETIDLDSIGLELNTNYLSYIHLTKAFVPFFQAKREGTMLYTSSGLAFVPLTRCPNYCATKAALHHFLMSLRVQLESSGIKVVEVIPPAVQSRSPLEDTTVGMMLM
jgi:short-subunit dehydrogenase involved in D-alanine esterification of teichoic acids